jgi:50S ribosomal subunit-associated GTPase HflX
MTNTGNDINSLQKRVDELQNLLADVHPQLTAYYHQEKAKTDRSAIHQGKASELRELINRVATHVGKHPVDG